MRELRLNADLEGSLLDVLDDALAEPLTATVENVRRRTPEGRAPDRASWGRTPEALESERLAEQYERDRA